MLSNSCSSIVVSLFVCLQCFSIRPGFASSWFQHWFLKYLLSLKSHRGSVHQDKATRLPCSICSGLQCTCIKVRFVYRQFGHASNSMNQVFFRHQKLSGCLVCFCAKSSWLCSM